MKVPAQILILAVLAPGLVVAQATSAPTGSTIYGAQTPQLIPDIVAYRMVFDSFKVADPSNPAMVARQLAKLKRLGLSSADTTTFTNVVAQYYHQYLVWKGTVKATSLTPRAQSALQNGMNTIVQQTQAVLTQQLTPKGLAQLQTYVQEAKTRMVVAQ